MAIRNMALPLFGGGALILGYAAFSLFRAKRAREVSAPITLRETGLAKSSSPDLGALFLGQVTDALSPFGSNAGHGQFELDQFALEGGLNGERTALAANGEHIAVESHERIPDSERRPSIKRSRSRS